MKKFLTTALAGATLAFASASYAGPFILSGTDADDHGTASATANLQGWFYMQRALENLAPGVTNGNKVVSILGSTSTALSAAQSAFHFSSLVAAGWTVNVVTIAQLPTFFSTGVSNSGILMLDSGFNVTGGVDGSTFVPYASTINNFLGGGGGLFAQADGYQWVTTLLPTLQVVNDGGSALTLTAAGSSAFPGLTNADLSAGPWHESFRNVGAIPVLALGESQQPVIIGSSAGTITNPGGTVPEPESLALLGIGLAGFALVRRRKQA